MIGELRHTAGDNRANFQLSSHFLRVNVLPFELEHRTLRHHFDLRQLGDAVDDAVGHAIAEVVALRIFCRVDERQHGERVNCPRCFVRATEKPRGGHNERHDRNSSGNGSGAPAAA